MPEHLATGPALALRLAGLSVRLIGGEIPARIGRKLAEQVTRLERACVRHIAAESAIAYLQGVDPDLSTWAACGQLSDDLTRFGTAYRRIKVGSRPVRNDYEAALVTLVEIPGPCCQAKLWDSLTAPGE